MTLTPQMARSAEVSRLPVAARPKIEVKGLNRTFWLGGESNVEALRDVNLTIAEGEICCLLGPSGCGKTTLLRSIGGLVGPSSGRIEVATQDASRPLMAMVAQDYSVFPWKTVRANVGFPLKMKGVPKAEIETRVMSALRDVGLESFADAYPDTLSGGMKQRVAIARAFVTDPEILLMDEPLAALDAQLRQLLAEQLLALCEQNRKTVVFVTHSIEEAILLGDRVVLMGARPGRIVNVVDVPFERPRDPAEVRSSPEFARLREMIWDWLRGEVEKQLEEAKVLRNG